MSKPGKNEMVTRIDYVMREGATIAPIAFASARKFAVADASSERNALMLHCCPTEFGIECPDNCFQVYDSCIECWLKYMFIPREGAKE